MNTLEYAKKLEESGLTRKQSEVIVGTLHEMADRHLATSQDLELLRRELKVDLGHFRLETEQRFNKLDSKIEGLQWTLTKRMAYMFSAAIGVLAALPKVFAVLGW